LRPRFDRDIKTRGLPEWFNKYADEAFSGQIHLPKHEYTENGKRLRKRTESNLSTATGGAGDPGVRLMMTHEHSRSFAATIFSSGGSSVARAIRQSVRQTVNDADRLSRFNAPQEPELSGVDKFCFVQPKNRSRPKEWWKASTGNFAEKSLRVTQLQVAESFPAPAKKSCTDWFICKAHWKQESTLCANGALYCFAPQLLHLECMY
jgi:hypothetical protein